ncbi:MAG: regulatory protein RecX [Magnetococcales bacterium]|nr:regulatory protein RecX [Magnetococcales bacterium]
MSPEADGAGVMAQALRWLARRDYGVAELAGRLRREGAETAQVAEVIARCQALGYLNDRKFAASRVRARLARGWGELRIRAELRYLGIDDEMISLAWQESVGENDPVTRARDALERHYGTWDRSDPRARRRCYAFLARRGVSPEAIEAALV